MDTNDKPQIQIPTEEEIREAEERFIEREAFLITVEWQKALEKQISRKNLLD